MRTEQGTSAEFLILNWFDKHWEKNTCPQKLCTELRESTELQRRQEKFVFYLFEYFSLMIKFDLSVPISTSANK